MRRAGNVSSLITRVSWSDQEFKAPTPPPHPYKDARAISFLPFRKVDHFEIEFLSGPMAHMRSREKWSRKNLDG
ncbi:hypothetical protein RRG08_013397 [Elysia crispata]|uniref:Uncharacterized protein n=1 Tax=Elysia crispata TaxID=231223 RepID=A0AAE1B7W2_9GAST|nr:hypothetical protein RRG08_013397 [Elysia crispata]